MSDFVGELANAGVMSALLLVVVVGVEALKQRFGVEAELTRKLAHFFAAAALAVVPWQLYSLWAPVAFTLGFFVLMHASKRLGWLSSVHGIARRSSGAVLFPVAVLLTWLLAGGNNAAFKIAMLVLAIADPSAALVGRSLGKRRYFIFDQSRTLEGSAAFFFTACAVVAFGLLASGAPVVAALACAALIALLVTACEAVSVRGSDNVVIPLATLLLLHLLAPLSTTTLWTHLAVVVALLGGGALLFRLRGITFAASLTLAVYALLFTVLPTFA